jgi:ankyrin repeat protein
MDVHEEVKARIDEIVRAMRELKVWQSESLPPDALEFEAPFGADKLSYPQWLQFVFVPRARAIVEQKGDFPESSTVGTQAVREFDGVDGSDRLVELLCDFDRFIEALAPSSIPGATALEAAAAEGDLEKAQALIAQKVEITPTAFTWAVSEGTPEIVGLLLEHGADPNVRDAYGVTPVFFAAAGGHPALAAFLLDPKGTDIDAKHWPKRTTKVGHGEILWMLLDRGVDPNSRFTPAKEHEAPSNSDATPLIVAAAFGNIAAVDVLLGHGAKPRARDVLGRTALAWGEKRGHAAIIERLRSKTKKR